MYDELVKRLRAQAVYLPEKFSKNAELLDVLMKAADAVEKVQKRVPPVPYGDLIDRDALAEDGWVLTKQVMRMGGYAIHELPLKNPSIAVIIPAEEGE